MTLRSSLLAALLALTATAEPATAAPEPSRPVALKPVDIGRYIGRWYEVARVHNRIEAGCVRAMADYSQTAQDQITAVETCYKAAGGAPRVWRAQVRILDPGTNAKLHLSFFPFVARDYWVFDHDPDYAWAVVGTPDQKYLWLFARRPDLSDSVRATIVARAKGVGFDTSRLEYATVPGPAGGEAATVAETAPKAGEAAAHAH